MFNCKFLSIAVVALIGCSATAVFAADQQPVASNAQTSGIYASGQLGAQFLKSKVTAQGDTAKSFSGVSGHVTNLAGGAAVGYQFDNHLRFELAYSGNFNKKGLNYTPAISSTSNPSSSKTPVSAKKEGSSTTQLAKASGKTTNPANTSNATTRELKTSLRTVMAKAYYTFDTNTLFSPFVDVGAGVAHVSYNDAQLGKTVGANSLSGSKDKFAWTVGVGASYQLANNLFLDGAVDYVDAGKVTVTQAGAGKNAKAASYKLNAKAFDTTIGVRYLF